MEKQWYKSKGVWIGVLVFLTGSLPIITELLKQEDISTVSILTAVMGILGVAERISRGDIVS